VGVDLSVPNAQKIVDAFLFNTAPRYLVRDNDGIYGAALSQARQVFEH
jgi:hypothetical protein